MIRAISLSLVTAQHRANLATLAAYLAALPSDYELFRMNQYAGWGPIDQDMGEIVISRHQITGPSEILHLFDDHDEAALCGTCACAVGHGPLAGILPPETLGGNWAVYEQWAFGVSHQHEGTYREAWEFMFGPHWPNDPHAAAARIMEFLS